MEANNDNQNHWPAIHEVLEMERRMGERDDRENSDFSWRCNLAAYRLAPFSSLVLFNPSALATHVDECI